jgi:predicted outer membrane repeat protein
MIRVKSGKVAIGNCDLAQNSGIKLLMSINSTTIILNSKLTHNYANVLIQIRATDLTLNNSTFSHNVAELRITILYVRESTVKSHHTLTIVNNTSYQNYSFNIVDIRDSEVKFGEVDYSNNTGSILFMHSKAKFTMESKFQNHIQEKGAYSYGGAITSIASMIIRFQGTTSFCNNYAKNKGGAIYATASRVYTNGDSLFSNNQARWSGGALYLDQSDFVCQKKCRFFGNTAIKGGAIHAISSIFTMGSDWNKFVRNKVVKSSLFFASNSADEGGAINLEANSKLRAPRGERPTYELEFDNNVATLGGAIFVNDYTNICNHSVCFIQAASSAYSTLWSSQIRINSTSENTTIYGGLLDRCTVGQRYSGNDLKAWTVGFDYIKRLAKNVNIKDTVTSDPVRVCYCIDRELNCSYTERTIDVKRGETFNISVAAVDQAYHTVDASIFITSTKSYTYRLGIGQWVQTTHNGCTDLELKVSSLNESVKLILYPEGPCHDIGISKAVLHVNFKACTCPIGFQQLKMQEDCVCDLIKELRL